MRMIPTPRAIAITTTTTITIIKMMEEILMIRVRVIMVMLGIVRRVGDRLVAGLFCKRLFVDVIVIMMEIL